MGLFYAAIVGFGIGCVFSCLLGGDTTLALYVGAITWVYAVVGGGLLFLYRS